MKKKLAALALTLILLTRGGLLTVPAAAFSDVDEGLYYAAPIAWAVEKGITTGTSETTFSPDVLCTRRQIITFLWRYAGEPAAEAPAAFTDVAPEADYAQAVAWAVGAGITEGTADNTFSPGEVCTRGQIATFLYRCLNEAGEKAELPEDSAPAPAQEPDEDVRPQQVLTGEGKAYSLGLDGSEFTADDIYEAKATVEIYSAYDAVFTVKVPFPLYQACSYTVRFDDPKQPGEGYLLAFLRWDEAFADIIPWEGSENGFRFTKINGGPPGSQAACSFLEEHRTDGELSWRVSFPEGGPLNFNLLANYDVSCEVSSNV